MPKVGETSAQSITSGNERQQRETILKNIPLDQFEQMKKEVVKLSKNGSSTTTTAEIEEIAQ